MVGQEYFKGKQTSVWKGGGGGGKKKLKKKKKKKFKKFKGGKIRLGQGT